LGCQFHPEFKSKPLEPQPLFASFVEAASKRRRLRMREEQQQESDQFLRVKSLS
jgi:CTP synthase